jgi:hypothetical protein
MGTEEERPRAAGFRLPACVLTLLTALALLAPSSGYGVVLIAEIGDDGFANFDARTATVSPTAEQLAAVERIGATARWNDFGTPRSLVKHGGYLATGIEADSAVAAARSWVNANRGVYRLSSADALEVVSAATLADSDTAYAVVFRQGVAGLGTADSMLSVGLAGSAESGWSVAYAGSTLTGDEQLAGATELSAVEAFVEAAQNVDEPVSEADVSVRGRRQGWTELEVEGLRETGLVRRVAFATPKRGAVHAYETIVVDGPGEGYRHVVDAETGRILLRESIVDNAVDNPKWLVFPAYPQMTQINEYPWNYPSADIRDLWCWLDAPACKLAVANPASPVEWDKDARTNTPTFTTTGNNNAAYEAWFGSEGTRYQPTSPTRDYVYPWENVWFEQECDPAVLVPGGNDIDAATANLFAMHNRMHDWTYNLGFTEERWNAQDYNFGRPFLENDKLEGRAQSGAIVPKSRDNANMATRPDGTSSITNMFLWQPLAGAFYAPCVDGDYDMVVIGHEFGHMVENRMIGKGVRRQGHHAGAMGESFGDLNGVEYVNEYGFVPVAGEDPFSVGAYVTGNGDRAIRNYNMSYPSAGAFPRAGDYSFVNPLNFSDIGYDLTGPQVHADGEIWSATNFDIRDLMLRRYPGQGLDHQRECADGERPAQECPGNRRWFQLYYDAMVLMPVAPSMLDARDAVLAADVMRFGGSNQDLLWLAFARRGFGQNALSTNDSRDDTDTDPTPSFESPLHEEATVVFGAVSEETGQPVGARVYVGHYEARVSPIADTDPATSGENLDNLARFVPDDGARTNARVPSYEFVAHAQGYGHVRFRLTELKPGETRNVTIRFPRNVASRHQGAVATGDGERHQDLIDDTEATNWESADAPAQGRQVLIQLAGPQTFRLAKVSAALRPARQDERSQNRFTALRAFELFACTAGADSRNPGCDPAVTEGWKRILKSQADAFPGDNPRPVQPILVLRTFEVPTTTATHVLFRVVDNQCTGQESFQGEQDQDPSNPTDCRETAVAEQVRAAEVQLQTVKPRVDGAQVVE